jgi:hypothetical protein
MEKCFYGHIPEGGEQEVIQDFRLILYKWIQQHHPQHWNDVLNWFPWMK